MRTSFYFVVWILIYPLLGLLNSSAINQNSFMVALLVVFGLSYVLNRSMPHVFAYERSLVVYPVLEDVYSCNVRSFSRRLSQMTMIEFVTAVYFCFSFVFILFTFMREGINGIFSLVIFGFLAFAAIRRSVELLKARSAIRANPTPEQCMDIATDTFHMDYASYYEARQVRPYPAMFPPRPRHFRVFQIFSIVIAAVAVLLGLRYIVSGILLWFAATTSAPSGAAVGMLFLYGLLATYFGIKDIIAISQNFSKIPVARKD